MSGGIRNWLKQYRHEVGQYAAAAATPEAAAAVTALLVFAGALCLVFWAVGKSVI